MLSPRFPVLPVVLLFLVPLGCHQPNRYVGDPSDLNSDAGATPTGTGGRIDAVSPITGSDGPSAGPSPTDSEVADGGATPTAACGNGVVELGEECDTPASCPTDCPKRGCTRFVLQGLASSCTARCVEMGAEAACLSGDACCPSGCSTATDRDCSVKCDNGVREEGETCDPLTTCPTACPAQGCQLRKLINQGTCAAECVNDRQQSACTSGDGCCPSNCNNLNDGDCEPRCGNGVREGSERCDPLSSCPSSCPNQGCQLRRLVDGGTCGARCEDAGSQTECRSGDGCCPGSGCSFANDRECPVRCGDADGMCPSGCSFNQDRDCKKPNGQSCGDNGECQSANCKGSVCCGSNQHGCSGQCKNDADVESCGSRCEPCPVPAGGNATCDRGQCGMVCPSGQKPCGAGCAQAGSVDVLENTTSGGTPGQPGFANNFQVEGCRRRVSALVQNFSLPPDGCTIFYRLLLDGSQEVGRTRGLMVDEAQSVSLGEISPGNHTLTLEANYNGGCTFGPDDGTLYRIVITVIL